MPIDNTRSHSEIVQELMDAYEKTGKIGKITQKIGMMPYVSVIESLSRQKRINNGL